MSSILGALPQPAAERIEFFELHFLEKYESPRGANQRAGMLVEPCLAQTRTQRRVLRNLNLLRQFTERTLVFVAWERGLCLRRERRVKRRFHDRQHFEKHELGKKEGESKPREEF